MTDDEKRRRLADRYRLDGVLGRGGMSEVYYGYDERLDRPVAIKLLRPSIEPPDDVPGAEEIREGLERDRARFLREIRTTARLELPGTPAVYDTGSDSRGSVAELWLVMQLLRGTTVETVLDATDAEHLSVSWAAAVIAQTAAVLADVHRIDVVHRDIKPANLMIVDGGLVKVLDFGISILKGSGALPRLTQVDRTVGTPPYMSPEQCLGQPVAASSDVYSLGCLLCELLTGDAPFHDSPDFSLRAQHVQAPPPSVRGRRPEVPAELDDLVGAMLAKDAGRRPSAEQVYDALTPWCGSAAPDGTERDPTRPFRRPLLAPPSPREAVEADGPPLSDNEVAAVRAEARALLADERSHEAVQRLERAVDRSAGDPFDLLQLRHELAAALMVAGEFRRAAVRFAQVGAEYGHYLQPANPLVLDCAHDAGLCFAEVGDHPRAEAHLRAYLDHARLSDDPESIADARKTLALVLAASGRPTEAEAELRAAQSLLVALHGSESIQVRNVEKHVRRLEG